MTIQRVPGTDPADAASLLKGDSPQVILVAGGRPLWSASHGAVTGQAIGRALVLALPDDAEGEDGPRTVR